MPSEVLPLSSATRVTAIVVTYNSERTARRCIISLVEAGAEVIVVDNGSSDATQEVVAATDARFIQSQNNGFGAGCNLGASFAATELLLFQNPDSALLPETLELLVKAYDSCRSRGLAIALGPMFSGDDDPATALAYLLWFTSLGLLSKRRRRPRGKLSPLDGRYAYEVPRLSGASMLVDRESFEAIGGFDERFFLYGEDVDLSIRLRARGTRLGVVPGTHVHHLRAASTANRKDIQRVRSESLLYLSRKHRGPAGALLTAGDILVSSLVGALVDISSGRFGRARGRVSRIAALRTWWSGPRIPAR